MYMFLLGQESARFQIHSHISTFQDVNTSNMLNPGVFFLPILDYSLKSLTVDHESIKGNVGSEPL